MPQMPRRYAIALAKLGSPQLAEIDGDYITGAVRVS